MSPACRFRAERGKVRADTAACWQREGARSSGMTREALSTEAACAGGPARSSNEAPVMGVERRGRAIRDCVHLINREFPGRSQWTS